MAWLLLFFINVVVVFCSDLPTVDYNAQWGPHNDTCSDNQIRPFQMKFDDNMVKDLRMRLRNYRHPAPTLQGVNFHYGFNTNGIDSWLNYWANEYDFDARLKELNKFPQYTTCVQGLNMHFLMVEPENKTKPVVPLLMLHGWPGSVREFYDVILLLIADSDDRDFSIKVIVPSLPGFGCSDAASRPGLGGVEISVVMRNLMHKLGHPRFYVQGGDWGSYIGTALATLFPEEVAGFHTNLPVAMTPKALMLMAVGAFFPDLVMDSSLNSKIYPILKNSLWLLQETGYLHFQATKPETLGAAMSDSPGGLAAYFIQLIAGGTRKNSTDLPDGGILNHFTRDQILDNIMLYWANNKITTSSRIYYETIQNQNASSIMEYPTEVPVWALQAPDEMIYMTPQMLKTKFTNLLRTNVLEEGGHFLALEKPVVFANDVLHALKEFIRWNYNNNSVF